MSTAHYESELLGFLHLRRPGKKRSTTIATVTYPDAGFALPNFYGTITSLDEEHTNYDGVKVEATTFAGTGDYIGNIADLETKIPNLQKLMGKIKDRGEDNTAETFWGDVNNLFKSPLPNNSDKGSGNNKCASLYVNFFVINKAQKLVVAVFYASFLQRNLAQKNKYKMVHLFFSLP